MPIAYLDDLKAGQRFISATHTVSEAEIIRFAREFDPQPFHVDPVAAQASFFKGLVASGWHTGAISMQLLVRGELQLAGGMIGGGGELTWPVAVRPGDTLQVHSEILDVRPSKSHPERGTIVVRHETRNQRGEAVQLLSARLVVPVRPKG